MIIIGLTGGIATGKSSISSWLSSNTECCVIDADLIARQVVEPGTPALKELVSCFGSEVLLNNGSLDRDSLAAVVFSNEEKRIKLNRITHHYIQQSILWKIWIAFMRGYKVVILDVPLLFETGLQKALFMHKTIVVACDHEIQLKRLMQRNELSMDEALLRINSQMKLTDKLSKADYIIDNNGSLKSSQDQSLIIINSILQSKRILTNRFFILCFISIIVYLFYFICSNIVNLMM